MHARAPILASRAYMASGQPLIIKGKRGGTGRQSGSGPSGAKATPRALLSRAMRERPGVALVVTTRQAARVEAKKHPPKIIYGKD